MARSRRGLHQARSLSRQTAWNAGTGGTGALSLSASGSSFVGSALTATVEGTTLVRTRGQLDIVMTGPGANDGDGMQGAFGIGIATDPAVAIGITAVPTPITEQDWEGWLYWTTVSVHNVDVTAGAADSSSQRVIVDSKAMRKFPEDVTMFAVIEVVEIGAATIDVFWDSRCLFKLP